MSSYHHGNLRTALLEAAEQELEKKGIEGLSLRQVAKHIGVSHAAPAKHFRTANDLLTALATVSFQKHLAAIQASLEKTGNMPREKLVTGGMAYVTYAVAQPNMFDLQFNSKRPDRKDPELAKAGSAAFSIVVKLVGDAVSDKRADEIFSLATSYWIFLHGMACLASNNVLGRLDPSDGGGSDMPRAGSDAFIRQLIKAQVERLLA